MRLKVLACEVLTREICYLVAHSPHVIDLTFTKKDGHDLAECLRQEIQREIDGANDEGYDAILLGYGLCGNATVELQARGIPLVIPRAHDCCTLFLGSRLKFKELFGDNPSQPFSSLGYMERGDQYSHSPALRKILGLDRTYEDYVLQYGEENARYIMETLSLTLDLTEHQQKVLYIEIPETHQPGAEEEFRQKAAADGKEFVPIRGDLSLLRNLLHGQWNEEDFLVVPPGETIVGVYDWDTICRATRIEEKNDENLDS